MREPITSKQQMYAKLAAGDFGNTTNQYFSIEDWKASSEYGRFETWGLRSMTAGGPCRMYCPRDEVEATLASWGKHVEWNMSVMVDAVCTVRLWADVFIDPLRGLTVYGIENPPKGGSWRKLMPEKGRTFGRLESLMVLRRTLNASSHADLLEVLESYPDHVVELSALSVCMGIFPHRNGVVWEVRCMTGEYERSSWGNNAWEPLSSRPDGD